jgi:hypothetical protein
VPDPVAAAAMIVEEMMAVSKENGGFFLAF